MRKKWFRTPKRRRILLVPGSFLGDQWNGLPSAPHGRVLYHTNITVSFIRVQMPLPTTNVFSPSEMFFQGSSQGKVFGYETDISTFLFFAFLTRPLGEKPCAHLLRLHPPVTPFLELYQDTVLRGIINHDNSSREVFCCRKLVFSTVTI